MGRMMLLAHVMTKVTRYARNIKKGGHRDSLDDGMVYMAMLSEMDDIAAAAREERAAALAPSPTSNRQTQPGDATVIAWAKERAMTDPSTWYADARRYAVHHIRPVPTDRHVRDLLDDVSNNLGL
jgi:hypothetical protein